jgi:hypothetical protein
MTATLPLIVAAHLVIIGCQSFSRVKIDIVRPENAYRMHQVAPISSLTDRRVVREVQLNADLRLYWSLIRKVITTGAAAASFLLDPSNSQALEWTERQRLAAETWRTVDDLYIDRTFNGQDWFKLRQSVVKRDYKTDEELFSGLRDMIGKLGDKYTRFLTPAQYSALLSSTKGELVGLGVELGQREGSDSPYSAKHLYAHDINVLG